jgi:hypothetical protein
LGCCGDGVLRGFAFGAKEVDEVLDLVGLENVPESGHRGSAVLDLMLDFFFAQAFAYGAEVRASLAAAAVYAVAMLAALLVEERGSCVFCLVRVGVNDLGGLSYQAACQDYDDDRETEGSTKWRGDFAGSLQRSKYLSAMIYRGWRAVVDKTTGWGGCVARMRRRSSKKMSAQ